MNNQKRNDAEKNFMEAIACQRNGKDDEAIKLYKKSLRGNPQKFEAYANLGTIYRKRNNLEQASASFEQAIRLRNNDSSLLYDLGLTYYKRGKKTEAIVSLEDACLHDKQNWKAYLVLGKIYLENQCLELAKECFLTVIKLNSDVIDAHVCLNSIYRQENDVVHAKQCLQEILIKYPEDPELHGFLAEVLLRFGQLYEGFIEYEWRKKRLTAKERYVPFLSLPQWQGEFFSGKKLLVYYEQGLGDTLQFIRYLPQVKARGGFVALLCQAPLLRLFENFPGIDLLTDNVNPEDFDCSVALMSLPRIFGSSANTIPSKPYITADSEVVGKWKQYIGNSVSYKVGLVWSGNTYNNKIPNRSCAIEDLAPLAKVKNVIFYSLQIGDGGKQLENPPTGLHIIDLADKIKDFADTAGAIMNLDLLISIDTSVPHLAGGLGKPTWIALPSNSEWRWLVEREDSIWYPTVRLFRQKVESEWQYVFESMAEELNKITRQL